MNQLKKFSLISFVVFFFLAVNVSCLRGNNSSSIDADIKVHQNENESFLESYDLEGTSDKVADQLVDGIVSALQLNSNASFLESASTFDFKKEAKAQAKLILKDMLKAGIEPFEQVVAKSVKPPTIPSNMYKVLRPFIVNVFNQIEKKLNVNVPDSVWDFEETRSVKNSRKSILDDEDDEESDSDDDDDDDLDI